MTAAPNKCSNPAQAFTLTCEVLDVFHCLCKVRHVAHDVVEARDAVVEVLAAHWGVVGQVGALHTRQQDAYILCWVLSRGTSRYLQTSWVAQHCCD